MTKKISIIVPIYNEEANISLIAQALKGVMEKLTATHDYELLLVNDGSKDGSQAKIEELSRLDNKIRYIELSRNFGKEAALSAALAEVSADAALMIDADLQHPVELIPEFIAKWEAGADVVVGVRTGNKGEGLIKRYGSKLFYYVMKNISKTPVLAGSTDFRLVDRKVIDAFNKLEERDRMTRALIDWLGFRRDYIKFEAGERVSGRAGYGVFKLIHLALSSFVSHSLIPLKLAGYLGVIITLLSGLLGLVILIGKYLFGFGWVMSITGTAQLAILNIFLIGIVLSSLGLVALYVALIRDEVTGRPLYVVRNRK